MEWVFEDKEKFFWDSLTFRPHSSDTFLWEISSCEVIKLCNFNQNTAVKYQVVKKIQKIGCHVSKKVLDTYFFEVFPSGMLLCKIFRGRSDLSADKKKNSESSSTFGIPKIFV